MKDSMEESMKAIIEFNLPDDKDEYETYMAAERMAHALYDLYSYYRQQTKYGLEEHLKFSDADKAYFDSEEEALINKVRDHFNDVVNEYNLYDVIM